MHDYTDEEIERARQRALRAYKALEDRLRTAERARAWRPGLWDFSAENRELVAANRAYQGMLHLRNT